MKLFECSPEDLATQLAKSPELYNEGVSFLRTLKGAGVFSREVEGDLEASLEFLNAANGIARDSDYFVFDTWDSWINEQGGQGEGYTVFQRVGKEMVERLGGALGVPSFEDAVKFLKRKKIRVAYTLYIPPEGYFGLKRENVDDGDGHRIDYYEVGERFIEAFQEEGIKVIELQSP